MEPKPGWKTTEFWLTIANTIFMVLVAFGLISQEQAAELEGLLATLIAAVLPIIVYIVGRSVVKVNANGN